MKQIRKLRATLDPSAIRTEQFEGREHLVVPIIALAGDAVISAMGSKGPELVPAEELAKFPQGWNYRPGTMDHPAEGSANAPLTLENHRVGNIFNSAFVDNQLKMEGWIDVDKATALGGDASRLLERLRNAEVVEISVGASIELQPIAGTTQDGKSFVGRWTDIVPDHVAFLPEGTIGAFSVEMGGGTRTARAATHSGLIATIRNLLSDKGMSNEELKRKLWIAVSELPLSSFGVDADKVNAEYWGIDWVYPDSLTCISVFYIDNDVRFFRHKYRQEGVKVSISGSPEEVVSTEPRFETLSKGSDNKPRKGDANMGTKQEKVRKLIQLSSFTDENEKWLLEQPDEQIDKFLLTYDKPAEPVEPVAPVAATPEPAAAVDETVVTVTADWKAQADQALAYVHQQQVAEQNAAIAALKGKVSFTDQQLRAMDLSVLKTLAADVQKLDVKPEPADDQSRTASQPVYAFQAPVQDATLTNRIATFKPAPNPFAKRQPEVN